MKLECRQKIYRPALRYYGGKWKIAHWIIQFFPPHVNYVEPCGGAMSVLLQKEPARLETCNDIDDRVVNFFEVLRSREDELLRLIRLTPWSRRELENAKEPADDPVEDARRFFVACWQSFSKHGGSWRSMYDFTKRPRAAASDIRDIEHLHLVADRLGSVQFENKDALDVIQQYDTPDTLIYFDPPYLSSVRVNHNYYAYEVDQSWHVSAAELLQQAQGDVVVSGYRSALYADLYESNGWARLDKPAIANGGAKRIESVWLSPSIQDKKDVMRQGKLF